MNSLINPMDLGVLSVTGEDAASFLQGQTTCDIYEVVKQKSQLGAFCNPKGKVIAIFFIVKTDDGFLLTLPKSLLITIQELLERYKLRAKVTISEFKNCPVEPFLKSAHVRIPWIFPETSEQFIPQALKLDKFGAISLTKGCYTGQEIVVRTHYLGEVKRQLHLAICEAGASVETNCRVLDENQEEVGTVLLAQVRGLSHKEKDPITGNVLEEKTINKTLVLCVINTEEATNFNLHLDNLARNSLKIIGGEKHE